MNYWALQYPRPQLKLLLKKWLSVNDNDGNYRDSEELVGYYDPAVDAYIYVVKMEIWQETFR